MENLLKKSIVRIEEPPHPTIAAIRDVCALIEQVENRFTFETDPDLIESCVYELQSLRAQYRYLLRESRKNDLRCEEKHQLWNEGVRGL